MTCKIIGNIYNCDYKLPLVINQSIPGQFQVLEVDWKSCIIR